MKLIDDAIGVVEQTRSDIAAVLREIPIGFGWLEYQWWATYNLESRSITLATDTGVDHTPYTVALDLIHEGTHALDHVYGRLNCGDTLCSRLIEPEQRAKRVEMEYMTTYFSAGYPGKSERAVAANQWLECYRAGNVDRIVALTYERLYR